MANVQAKPNPKRPNLKLQRELQVGDAKFLLRGDPQWMQGYLEVAAGMSMPRLGLPPLMRALEDLHLRFTEDAAEKLSQFIASVNAGNPPGDPILIAEGALPSGSDGRIIWLIEREPTTAPPPEAWEEVDLHEMGDPIVSVSKGEALARIEPPVEGEPGQNIFGKAIPIKPHATASISAGKGVRLEVDGTLIADCDGRLVARADAISIEPVLTISGNVDFATGNITFTGVVEVARDVLDDFHVRGDQGIRIRGMAGSARIESATGDIEIVGGIAGLGKGTVSCGGSIKTGHLNHVDVQARGDVQVHGEVVNSVVVAGGRITIGKKIIGGETIAGEAIEVGTVGSPIGIKTRLRIGIDDAHEKRLGDIEAWRKGVTGRHPVERAVVVRQLIHAETVIQIGDCQKVFNEDIRGPVGIILDEDNGELKLVPWKKR